MEQQNCPILPQYWSQILDQQHIAIHPCAAIVVEQNRSHQVRLGSHLFLRSKNSHQFGSPATTKIQKAKVVPSLSVRILTLTFFKQEKLDILANLLAWSTLFSIVVTVFKNHIFGFLKTNERQIERHRRYNHQCKTEEIH